VLRDERGVDLPGGDGHVPVSAVRAASASWVSATRHATAVVGSHW
jgi:hypothetical protein